VHRLLRAFPFTIAALLVLTGGIAFAAQSILSSSPPVSTPTVAQGTPAITPRLPGRVPAFTESDVRAYFAHFPFPGTTTGLPATVTSVQFITREQASAAMNGESLSEVPSGALVCYVVLTGHFNPRALGPMPADAKPRTDFITSAHMVFDATTGNLLVLGY
jgi:hypothetical protein